MLMATESRIVPPAHSDSYDLHSTSTGTRNSTGTIPSRFGEAAIVDWLDRCRSCQSRGSCQSHHHQSNQPPLAMSESVVRQESFHLQRQQRSLCRYRHTIKLFHRLTGRITHRCARNSWRSLPFSRAACIQPEHPAKNFFCRLADSPAEI